MRIKTKEDRRDRIKFRIRKRMAGTTQKPRLSVFRSEQHIYVQVIDDMSGTTLASAASTEKALKDAKARNNIAGAKVLGKTIAERLIDKGIKHVVFDRGGFLYHGRIKAVAEAAREAGLEF